MGGMIKTGGGGAGALMDLAETVLLSLDCSKSIILSIRRWLSRAVTRSLSLLRAGVG